MHPKSNPKTLNSNAISQRMFLRFRLKLEVYLNAIYKVYCIRYLNRSPYMKLYSIINKAEATCYFVPT